MPLLFAEQRLFITATVLPAIADISLPNSQTISTLHDQADMLRTAS